MLWNEDNMAEEEGREEDSYGHSSSGHSSSSSSSRSSSSDTARRRRGELQQEFLEGPNFPIPQTPCRHQLGRGAESFGLGEKKRRMRRRRYECGPKKARAGTTSALLAFVAPLLGAIPSLGRSEALKGPEPQTCLDLDMFLRCASDFWKGEDLSDRNLPLAIAQVVQRPSIERACPAAKAAALAVTSRIALELSYPLLRELPGSLLFGTDDLPLLLGRLHLEQELKTFVSNLTLASAALLGRQRADDLDRGFGSALLTQLSLINEQASKLAFFQENPTPWPAADGVTGTRLLRAAAQDSTWDEAFLPLHYRAEDIPGFWDASGSDDVIEMFRSAGQNFTFKDVFDFADRQEEELKACFFEVLDALEEQTSLGILVASWPRSSTLLALLRYGRLFGHYADGSRDCVDDDLDLEVALPDAPGAWFRFVLDMTQRLEKLGYWCFLGSTVDELVGPNGRYENLFCRATRQQTLCPVSFLRSDPENTPQLFAYCLAYQRAIACPADTLDRLASYSGCFALPNIDLAAMTFGNDCVLWMRNGLDADHIALLQETADMLSSNGFLSMQPVWQQEECQTVPYNVEGRLWVGDASGTKVQERYRASNSDTNHFLSCLPMALGEENYHRCDVRESVLQQVRRSILDKRPKGKRDTPILMAVLDGPSVCCPTGVSQKWTNDASGVDVLTLCMGPETGERNQENLLGRYNLDALRQLCPYSPDILVTDVLPSPAGTTGMLTAMQACWPRRFWLVSEVLHDDLRSLQTQHLKGLIEEAPEFSDDEKYFSVWRVLR